MKRFFSLLATVSLMGCGGGGGGDDTQTSPIVASMSGKVIDGYVVGATVFLDINGNGEFESFEPHTVTSEGGDYSLELTEFERKCTEYVPTMVNVPVGAFDEELGEVTEPYQMMLAPATWSSDKDRHITPFTSLAWNEALSKMSAGAQGEVVTENASCTKRMENASEHKTMLEHLDRSTADVAALYHMTIEQIHSDYVANNDTESHELAIKIVKGFKQSFKEKAEVLKRQPKMYIFTHHYKFIEDINYGEMGIDPVPGWERSFSHYDPDTGKSINQRSIFDEPMTTEFIMHQRKSVEVKGETSDASTSSIASRGLINELFTCAQHQSVWVDEGAAGGWMLGRTKYGSEAAMVSSPDDCTIEPTAEFDNSSFTWLSADRVNTQQFGGSGHLLDSFALDDYAGIWAEVSTWGLGFDDDTTVDQWFKSLTKPLDNNTNEVTRINSDWDINYAERYTQNHLGQMVEGSKVCSDNYRTNDYGWSVAMCK
ncbi:hypothetical protein [Vibrio sp. CB1-14]|uniref:Lipoprotein n=1 Tax=Vibrio chaetopteri TaxID=3016528 RepID=A0AAU8BNS5_9VIBR